MNSLTGWGAFQIGGIIGCSIGIACIVTGALPALVAVGAAMLIWAIAGFAIASVARATDAMSDTLTGQVVRSTTDFVNTTASKVVTGVAVAGLVTTATVVNMSPSGQVAHASTSVETLIASSSQIEPTTSETTVVTVAAQSENGCGNLNLTTEELANCGAHQYDFVGNVSGTCAYSGGAGSAASPFLFKAYQLIFQ